MGFSIPEGQSNRQVDPTPKSSFPRPKGVDLDNLRSSWRPCRDVLGSRTRDSIWKSLGVIIVSHFQRIGFPPGKTRGRIVAQEVVGTVDVDFMKIYIFLTIYSLRISISYVKIVNEGTSHEFTMYRAYWSSTYKLRR